MLRLLLPLVLFAPTAPEPSLPVELAWTAPAGCPDGEALRSRVAELVAGPGTHSSLRAEGRVTTGQRARWRLELALLGPDLVDIRSIEAADCDALTGVAALLIAIALAPEVAGDLVPAAELPAPPVLPEPPIVAAPPPTPAPVSPPTAPELPAPRRSSLRGALRIGGGAEFGAIPRWSPSLVFAAALIGRGWRVELVASHAVNVARYAALPEVGGRMTLWTGTARACGVPRWRRLELPVCGGLELGELRGVGQGVDDPARARGLWLAMQLAPGVAWAPRRWLALSVGLELLIALRRPAFHVETLPELTRAAAVGLRPVVGVELRFP